MSTSPSGRPDFPAQPPQPPPQPPGTLHPLDAPGGGVGSLPEDFVFPGTESINPFEVFSGPGYLAPTPRTDPIATTAMVFALLSFIPGASLLAIGFGWWALRRVRRARPSSGESQAWLGVVVGSVASMWWAWIFLLSG